MSIAFHVLVFQKKLVLFAIGAESGHVKAPQFYETENGPKQMHVLIKNGWVIALKNHDAV